MKADLQFLKFCSILFKNIPSDQRPFSRMRKGIGPAIRKSEKRIASLKIGQAAFFFSAKELAGGGVS